MLVNKVGPLVSAISLYFVYIFIYVACTEFSYYQVIQVSRFFGSLVSMVDMLHISIASMSIESNMIFTLLVLCSRFVVHGCVKQRRWLDIPIKEIIICLELVPKIISSHLPALFHYRINVGYHCSATHFCCLLDGKGIAQREKIDGWK